MRCSLAEFAAGSLRLSRIHYSSSSACEIGIARRRSTSRQMNVVQSVSSMRIAARGSSRCALTVQPVRDAQPRSSDSTSLRPAASRPLRASIRRAGSRPARSHTARSAPRPSRCAGTSTAGLCASRSRICVRGPRPIRAGLPTAIRLRLRQVRASRSELAVSGSKVVACAFLVRILRSFCDCNRKSVSSRWFERFGWQLTARRVLRTSAAVCAVSVAVLSTPEMPTSSAIAFVLRCRKSRCASGDDLPRSFLRGGDADVALQMRPARTCKGH